MLGRLYRKKGSFFAFPEGGEHTIEEIDGVFLVCIWHLLPNDKIAHLSFTPMVLRSHILQEGVLEDRLGLLPLPLLLLLLLQLEVLVQHNLYPSRLLRWLLGRPGAFWLTRQFGS